MLPALARVGLVLLLTAAAWLLVREQPDANQGILDALGEVKAALADQTRRAGELEQRIATLNDRVVNLEGEIATLKNELHPRSRAIACAAPAPLALTLWHPTHPWHR